MQTYQSYHSFSDFSEYNENIELGNDWGFYDDIEYGFHNASVMCKSNTYAPKKFIPKKFTFVEIQQYKSIPSVFKADIKLKKTSEQHKILILNRIKEMENNAYPQVKKISEYFTNGAIFTAFVVIILILN